MRTLRHLSAAAKSLQSCLTLCDPIEGSPPGSSVPGILQARILEWVAISPVHESEKWKWCRSVGSTLRNPMDCSLPGSAVHGISQARVLEWGAIVRLSDVSYKHLKPGKVIIIAKGGDNRGEKTALEPSDWTRGSVWLPTLLWCREGGNLCALMIAC